MIEDPSVQADEQEDQGNADQDVLEEITPNEEEEQEEDLILDESQDTVSQIPSVRIMEIWREMLFCGAGNDCS